MDAAGYDQVIKEIEAIASPHGEGFTVDISMREHEFIDVAVWARKGNVMRITTTPQREDEIGRDYWIEIAAITAIAINQGD